MEEVQKLLNRIPGTKEMMTIPGVAEVTLAGFLAEVGNLEDYTRPQQIIRLAGLNLKENSSGKHKGKTTISKRGRARLRRKETMKDNMQACGLQRTGSSDMSLASA